ncbi:glycosyltransferase family 4 protein [Dyadobacter bucti]|uniref:glycosyltransferase family 4 protein n=1 Tax=Dyadobacter bucti TaxID=2572203 RepID=UPI003F710C1C
MKDKKKLVYVLHDIALGGAEVALLSAVPALNEKYFLKIIVLGTVNQDLINNFTETEKRAFVSFNYPFYLYPFVLPRIIRAILDFDPEIMVCSLWRASLVGVFVKRLNSKIKFFSFNHSTRFPHKLSAFFTRAAAKTADVILTDGIATRDFVRDKLNPGAPIRTVSFLTNPTPTFIKNRKVGPAREVRFMFLGRINKVKNLPLVVDTIRYLRDRGVAATLDVYGRNDGDISETIAAIDVAKIQDHIQFKGEVSMEERMSLFDRYDFYIQLSTFEGMAMSVAEAMQHGLVCVVSPVGEIVHYAKDMESAIFIDISSEDRRQSDMKKIYEVVVDQSLYERLSVNCHQNFLQKPRYADSLVEELEK